MNKKPKILALSSGGGHWVQLLRLRPALAECDVVFATTRESYRQEVGDARFRVIPDCNRWSKIGMIRSALAILWMILTERPDIVLSTGAAPGFFGLLFGKILGSRTIWIDSVANAEEMSKSGSHVGKLADLWLTQWPHLAGAHGPSFRGSVL